MLIISTCTILNINFDLPILLIAYLLPLIVYSYDYYKDIEKDIKSDSNRAIYLNKKADKYPLIFGFYILLLVFLLLLFSNYSLILFIIAIVTGGFLYNFKLKELTKKIPAFKNIFTTFTWAAGGAFFPVFYFSLTLDTSFILIFALIFLRCLINVVYFDLKDIKNDKKEKLKTLPVVIGKDATIKFLYFLNFISFIPLILGVYLKIFPLFALFLLLFSIYGLYYIKKAEMSVSHDLEKLAHTLADSEFIIWPLVLIISKMLI